MSTIDAYETKTGRRWRVVYRKPDGAQTSRRGFQRKRDAEEWLAEHVTIAKASATSSTSASTAAAPIIEMGLIRRYKGAYLGENAGYVLMIGDDDENKEVLESVEEMIV